MNRPNLTSLLTRHSNAPTEQGEAQDLASLVRDYSESGVTPPDPDRVLAATSALPSTDALIWQRAELLGEVAEASAQAEAATATAEPAARAEVLGDDRESRSLEIAGVEQQLREVEARQSYFAEHLAPLGYRDTSTRETVRYYTTQGLLGLADVGSIAASAVNVLGDPLPLAIVQGLGVGVANVTVGQLGAVTRQRAERARRPETPPEEAETFGSWFGFDDGAEHDSVALRVGLAAVSLTFLGQFALRAVFDGSAVGLVYAALAVVVVAGSFVNSFVHGGLDEVARYGEGLDHDADHLRAIRAALSAPLAEAAGQRTEAEHARTALLARGEALAALARVEAVDVMVANPSMFGTHHSPEHRRPPDPANHDDGPSLALATQNGGAA